MQPKISFRQRQILAIATNAMGSRGAHVADSKEKLAVGVVERLGLVTVERTEERCAGQREWWVSITPLGVATLEALQLGVEL